MNWKRFFPLILLFSCIDGFIANYYYPAVLPLLYRDLFILLVYLLFLMQEHLGQWLGPLIRRIGKTTGGLALCFIVIGTAQVFNSNLPRLSTGLLGLKVYFFYWPLALLAYAYSEETDLTRNLLRWVVWLSIPINVFGLYQFWAGPDYLVDTFGSGFERAIIMTAFEGATEYEDSFLRVIGTFASAGQYAHFLVINCLLCFSLLLSSRSIREKLALFGALFLSFAALLATGSRGPLIVLALSALAAFRLCSGILRTSWIGLIAIAGIFVAFHWLGDPVIKRFETLRNMEMISNRTIETTPMMFQELLEQHPYGLGIGIATGASRYLAEGEEASEEIYLVENHPSKLLLEVGIVGVLFFYLFAGTMLIRWLTHWMPKDATIRNFLGPLSAYGVTFLALSFVIGGFDSPPQSLFFWVIVGIVTRLSAHTASL